MPTCKPTRADLKGLGPLLLLLVCLAAFLPACQRCSETPPLAKLREKTGSVDRDRASAVGNWTVAEVGGEYAIGDGVRTAVAAGATLDLDDGSVLALESDTLIRFLDKPPDAAEHALRVETGRASLEAGGSGATIRTSFGVAHLEGGSKVQLERADRGLRYEVLVGSARFEDGSGNSTELDAGEAILVDVGAAILERYEAGSKEGSASPENVEPPTDEAARTDEDQTGPVSAVVSGNGILVQRPGSTDFVPLEPGEEKLDAGSTLKLPSKTSVDLSRGRHRATLRGSGVFLVGGAQTFVEARSGTVSIASSGRVKVSVPGGTIQTSAGGTAELTALGKEGTQIRVTSKSVTIEGTKDTETVLAGQTAVLSPRGKVGVTGRGLDFADLDARAGESFVIHDPSPPTAVRFLFGQECDEGVIRLSGRTSSFAGGAKSVALALNTGRTAYALRCLGPEGENKTPAAQGTITVLRDAGTRVVPKKPPVTAVEVDGRRYTVLYQNQLPQVSFRWSKAPPDTKSFQLRITGPEGNRTYTTSAPQRTFPSGTLNEGTHRVYFEGGGRVSRQSTVTIRFDNAAAMARLETPIQTDAAPGSELTIAGTAMPGWDVTVNGQSVGQDASNRFSATAKMPTENRSIAVRLAHPTRGTHVYLRRAAGSQ